MNERLRFARTLLHLTIDEWKRQKPDIIGASIAFYILFSLGPLLFIMIEIVGLVFGKAVAESQIIHEIRAIVGERLADIVGIIIANAEQPPTSLITTMISIPMILFGSTMIFYQLKNALNHIWEVETEDNGITTFIMSYLSSFMMVLFAGGVLLVLVIKSFALTLLGTFLFPAFPFRALLMQTLDFLITFALITFLFAMIYKRLTTPEIRWSDEWIGASVTSLLTTLSQLLINIYFSRIDIGSAYGAVGSLSLLMIWIFYSSQVFLLGAVFTKVYAREYGSLRPGQQKNGAPHGNPV